MASLSGFSLRTAHASIAKERTATARERERAQRERAQRRRGIASEAERAVDWMPEVAVKAIRVAQVVALVLLAAYVTVFHAANPENVSLPGLISMPASVVVAVAIVVAWFVGWLPTRIRTWRLERKLTSLRTERDRLLDQLEPDRAGPDRTAVIPDRADPRDGTGGRHGDDPSDYL